MRCVLFGGGGFIGSAITDRLLLEGYQVRILERAGVSPFRQFGASENVQWCEGDLFQATDLERLISDTDAVIHLVSTTLPKSSNDDPIFDVQTNVVGSLRLLEAMVKAGTKKIIFISSGGTVYGRPKTVPITEDHPTDPATSYGITKLTIEKYLHLYAEMHGLQPVILRVANPYGERQRIDTGQGVIGTFLHRAINDLPIEIWGDGTVVRDFIHVHDVAEAFCRAVEYQGPQCVFNIGAGVGVALNELIDRMEKALNKPIGRKYHPARPFDVPASVLDISRAKALLQWSPTVTLDAGLARTIEWINSNRHQG